MGQQPLRHVSVLLRDLTLVMPSVAPTTRSGFVIATPAIANTPLSHVLHDARRLSFSQPRKQRSTRHSMRIRTSAFANRRARNLYAATVHYFRPRRQSRRVAADRTNGARRTPTLIEAIKSRFDQSKAFAAADPLPRPAELRWTPNRSTARKSIPIARSARSACWCR